MGSLDAEIVESEDEGSASANTNTVLWFEFLLNPKLLEPCLKKSNIDPSPRDMIVNFESMSVKPNKTVIESDPKLAAESDPSNQTLPLVFTYKRICLKVLSVKVFAYWKWCLEKLETTVPLQFQWVLMKDLLCICGNKLKRFAEDPQLPELINLEDLTEPELFAVVMYSRWVLHIMENIILIPKRIMAIYTQFIELPDIIISKVKASEEKSAEILKAIINFDKTTFKYPLFDAFVPPNGDRGFVGVWDIYLEIPMDRFRCLMSYELGIYKFHRECYSEAAELFSRCKDILTNMKMETNEQILEYCSIDEIKLNGFCNACGIVPDVNPGLLLQFYEDTANDYTNVINILQQDNMKLEIPLAYRDLLEINLASMLSCGKFTASRDLLLQIQTLNAVRRITEDTAYPTADDFSSKLSISSKKTVEMFLKGLKYLINTASASDKQHVHMFLFSLLEKLDPSISAEILSSSEIKMYFTESELDTLKPQSLDDTFQFPDLNKKREADQLRIKSIGNPQLELRLLERQIVESYDANELLESVTKYMSIPTEKSVGNINKWEVHISLEGVLKSLPNPFIQQYSFIILAKVKELLQLQSFTRTQELLVALDEQVRKFNTIACHRFGNLISWEILYCSVLELESNWPAKYINYAAIASKCKLCMSTLQQQNVDTNFLPRVEVMEQVIVTLLNLGEWSYIITNNYNKTFRYLELSFDIAECVLEIVKFKAQKNFPLGLWDKVLPAFMKVPSHPNALSRAVLLQFLAKLRDIQVINIMLSLLVKLYNILKEDSSNILLNFTYLHLWPSVISNAQSYARNTVGEVLFEYIRQILVFHPNNMMILRLFGDLHYANSYHALALKYYLEMQIVVNDNFSRSVPKLVIEDDVYRRMINCCKALQCYVQAAVLCQFLDEVDYSTAFKCLAEKNSSDATSSYYQCIWDTNILEYLINMHTKRNEVYMKQLSLVIIGQLELNANNNDEIKREAANVRKLKFLRAMSNQFIINNMFP